jgi:PAS domain S-box-containing protein
MIEPDIKVEEFDEPHEALDWLQTHSTDLMVLAMQMRGMDASYFISTLQKSHPSLCPPSLVLSQDEDRIMRLRAFETGAVDHMSIPVDPDEFILRTRRLLSLHHHLKRLTIRVQELEKELELSNQTRGKLIRESTQRLAQVIDSLPVLISATDHERRILFVNAVHMQFARVDPAQVVGQPAYHLFGDEHARRSEALDHMVLASGRSLTSYEEVLMDGYGKDHVFLTTKSLLHDHADKVTGVLTSSIEISDRKKVELHLHQIAHFDALTGLPNRLQLFAEMRPLIVRARRGDQLFALHVIDIDDFKSVKDRLGHAGADRFIIEIARRLQTAMRENDVVTRLGTDTFGILQSHVLNAQDASDFAEHMIRQITSIIQF